jgi:predicted RNase H-like HicB family nuclease
MIAEPITICESDGNVEVLDAWETREDYRIQLRVTQEDDVFTAVAVNLPGVGSQGKTKKEAITNAKEAAKGAIESYSDSGEEIPWTENNESIEGSHYVWVYVNA